MIRPPSRSTLFPTRRSSDLSNRNAVRRQRQLFRSTDTSGRHRRSEEHTSELQSPCNLVCRLLLEKKNIPHFIRGYVLQHSNCRKAHIKNRPTGYERPEVGFG